MPFSKKYENDEQRKKAIQKSSDEYHKRAMRVVGMRFHRQSDALVLAKLDSVENKTDYVRQLILRDIAEKR